MLFNRAVVQYQNGTAARCKWAEKTVESACIQVHGPMDMILFVEVADSMVWTAHKSRWKQQVGGLSC